MNFHIVNLGCKVNRVESDDAAARLTAHGWKTSDEASADLVVVNTCTVTGEADKKTRKAVRHALRANGSARVIVTGCAVAIDRAAYEALSDRIEIVEKHALANRLDDIARSHAIEGDFHADYESGVLDKSALLRVGADYPTRVGIKVQDGCDHACTYCIVHVARGRARSVSSDDVVREVLSYAHAGVKEIVLTGINLGSYCEHREGGIVRLPDLLRRLLSETEFTGAVDGVPLRFRVSSIEPMDVSPDLIDLMASSNGRICRHLHIPLQAGSSRVLMEMGRPYDAGTFALLVDRLRSAMPNISITTDVICGFPGETDVDFSRTIALASACGFSKMHVFPYSRREGTPAAARDDQVPDDVKADRCARLRALSHDLRAADREERAGTTELALVETTAVATTESYYEVTAPSGARVGELVPIVL